MEDIEILERLFFDLHFEYDNTTHALTRNLEKAYELYERAYKEVEEISVLLEDGLWFDISSAVLSIQTLGLAERAIAMFRQKLCDGVA